MRQRHSCAAPAAIAGREIFKIEPIERRLMLANVPTGPMGRTARLVPELKRYFVAVPQHGAENAKVLVFEVL